MRGCVILITNDPNWMWIYNILISKLNIWIPFTNFQFSVLKHTLAAPSQFHPNSWVMVQDFRDHLQNLGVPPSSNVFFYLFTFTRPSGGGLTTGGCLFEPMSIERFSSYVKSHFTTSNLYISRCLGLREQLIFGKLKSGNSLRLMFIGTRTLKLPG